MTSKSVHTKITLVLLLAALPVATMLVARDAHAQRKATATRGPEKALIYLDSTRERDGLRGPVRRVRTEVARFAADGAGRITEGRRRLLEMTVYDAAGRRIVNETYPVISGAAGQESNVFDAQGNLAETIVRDGRGQILSRTVYTYEFDQHGNWTKMTAAFSVVGPSGPSLEPVEVTYRAITYYSPGFAVTTTTANAGDARPATIKAGTAETSTGEKTGGNADRATESSVAAGSNGAATVEARQVTANGAREEVSSLPDAGLLNNRASSLPPPSYPVGQARPGRGLILVNVEVVIDETGHVISANAPNGSKELRAAAEEAARRALFAPFLDGGVPRKVRGTIKYTFPYRP
jgi:hypothetical protein